MTAKHKIVSLCCDTSHVSSGETWPHVMKLSVQVEYRTEILALQLHMLVAVAQEVERIVHRHENYP